jgi:hypothetical protein
MMDVGLECDRMPRVSNKTLRGRNQTKRSPKKPHRMWCPRRFANATTRIVQVDIA